MTKVIFETATISDAIRKAARIAPSKGAAFDKAQGIVIDMSPGTDFPVVVRATNLEIFSMEWVDLIEAEGEPVSWRVPASVFAQVMAGLPIGSGNQVTLEDKRSSSGYLQLHLTQARIKARFNLMRGEDYPVWPVFDPDTLFPATDLGGRISQVEWAAAKGDPPFSGVHFNGDQALSTDRYRLACVPLSIPDLKEPVTVPAGILGMVLKQTGEISIGVEGDQMLIMPDEHTQIRTILYGVEYPKVERIMHRDFDNSVKVKKTEVIERMTRATAFSGADRAPTLRVFIGKGEFAVMMNNEEIGLLGDVIELPGQCAHPRTEFLFTPKNIMEAISNSPNEDVEIFYDPEQPKKIIYLNGGSGYEAWVMPRYDTSTVMSTT